MIDSSGTFIAAYILVAVIFIGYSVSLWSRAWRVRRGLSRAPHAESHVDGANPPSPGTRGRAAAVSSAPLE